MANTSGITPATMPLAMSSNNNVNNINNVSTLESPSTTSSSPPSSSSLHHQTCPHKDDDMACECKTANANNTTSAKSFPFPPQSSSPTKKSVEHEDHDAINPLASPPLAALTKTTSNTGSHKSKRFSALRRGLSRTTTSSKRQSKSVYESGSDSEGERQRQRIKRGEEGQLAGVALAYIMQYRRGVVG